MLSLSLSLSLESFTTWVLRHGAIALCIRVHCHLNYTILFLFVGLRYSSYYQCCSRLLIVSVAVFGSSLSCESQLNT
jgi:hypothetical protein